MTHDRMAITSAWNKTWWRRSAPGGRLRTSPGLKRANRTVGTSTLGPVMSIIYYTWSEKFREIVLGPSVELVLGCTFVDGVDA